MLDNKLITDLVANLNPLHWNNLNENCEINLHDGILVPKKNVISLGELAGHS